jgi:putative flippase GtrA
MRVIRYFFVGGAAAAVDIGLFVLGAKWLGFPYLPVATVSFVVATAVNYFLSVRHVFESGVRFRKHEEIGLVFIVSALGLAVNQLILWLAVEYVGIELVLSKVCATGVVFFWNYGIRHFFIFRKSHEVAQ